MHRLLILFSLILTSCSGSDDPIVGDWTYLWNVENHTKERLNEDFVNGLFQVKFKSEGEMQYFLDDQRYGIGYYYYSVKEDSLSIINVQIDSLMTADTVRFETVGFKIHGDTLEIAANGSIMVYKRLN